MDALLLHYRHLAWELQLKMRHIMNRLFILFVVFQFLAIPDHLMASEKALTIIHTNDMHSHFLGASPNIDYTPNTTGEDKTYGGWARLATVIKAVKKNRSNPVLVLDAGDFLMGTLFHMLSREQAFELKLLHMMGYDAVTLGNHEFDLKPGGLARILASAHGSGQIPHVVISNVVFSQDSIQDDTLEKIFKQGIVKPFLVLQEDGLRIGLFGLMGKDAAEVAPFASPVTFEDPITTAQKMVKILKETEKADIIICLSHGGLSEDKKRSEDEILAEKVDGIDIIISGHSHTKTSDALQINDTIIVQAWEYGKQLGVLDVAFTNERLALKNYRLVAIDDTIRGDDNISNQIKAFEAAINRQVLENEDLSFREVIAETDFDLFLTTEESNLGNLIADSMRWFVLRNEAAAGRDSQPTVAVISNGVIRDPIVRGQT
ncbi:MAG: bifunctional metallophosphatase/5'-nucleotidase, partial [Deltaproteobacteria bacterium]|nr:bifunctional metallophosphatase/5'-nucleotidase [Deltaproteobacteria bacterium]